MRALTLARSRTLFTAAPATFKPTPYAEHLLKVFRDHVPIAKKLIEANPSPSSPTPFLSLRGSKLPSADKTAAADIAAFRFPSFHAMLQQYEALMVPVNNADATIASLTEDINAAEYQLAGASSLSADEKGAIEKKAKDLKAQRAEQQEFVLKYAAATFTTATFNSILSVLRVAIDTSAASIPDAYQTALRVMDDMRRCVVRHDATTDVLIRAIIFKDGVNDNSNLLWKCVELPELGDIVFTPTYNKATSWQIFNSVERRHRLRIPADAEEHLSDTVYHRIVPPNFTDIDQETEHDKPRPSVMESLTSPLKKLSEKLKISGPVEPAK